MRLSYLRSLIVLLILSLAACVDAGAPLPTVAVLPTSDSTPVLSDTPAPVTRLPDTATPMDMVVEATVTTSAEDTPFEVWVISQQAIAYTCPSVECDEFAVLFQGLRVIPIETDDGWHRFSTDIDLDIYVQVADTLPEIEYLEIELALTAAVTQAVVQNTAVPTNQPNRIIPVQGRPTATQSSTGGSSVIIINPLDDSGSTGGDSQATATSSQLQQTAAATATHTVTNTPDLQSLFPPIDITLTILPSITPDIPDVQLTPTATDDFNVPPPRQNG